MGNPADKPGTTSLRLGTELTAGKTGELKMALVGALAESGEVEFDFSAVETEDLTCLQLLCSTHRRRPSEVLACRSETRLRWSPT